jgi:hypothetical protein
MIIDLKTFESHDYIAKEDKIGYKEHDNIIFNARYGYKTLFAYYLENEKGKISSKSLIENTMITINCGSFSYAEIPREFTYIMGVTGTLKTLSEPEREVVEKEYKILKNTYAPSVFGANNLRFNDKRDILIENSHDYINRICKEIDDRMQTNIPDVKRPIFLFFESQKEIFEFYNSLAFQSKKEMTKILTEEADVNEKYNIIQSSTTAGRITLFTREFGRGTDFVVRDPTVGAQGGIHVIQVFFSQEISEEIQIKGRTARQGENGSYSLVLLDESLEQFLINIKDIEDNKADIYKYINNKRNFKFKDQYESNKDMMKSVKARHQESVIFLEAVKKKDVKKIKELLLSWNKGPEIKEKKISKTNVVMDATGSMGSLIQKSKLAVMQMFERCCDILKTNGIEPDSFQLQFSIYRNYNTKEEDICIASTWESKPENLKNFMNKISVCGGLGPEAIEIGLWHLNKESETNQINQVILIGDASSNTAQQVIDRRKNYYGEDYWKKTKFGPPTSWEAEAAKLKSKKIPIHGFYVNNQAKINFEQISSMTGGRCNFLDINSSKGADMLTDLVTEEILKTLQSGSSVNLVEAYQKKYGKSYV